MSCRDKLVRAVSGSGIKDTKDCKDAKDEKHVVPIASLKSLVAFWSLVSALKLAPMGARGVRGVERHYLPIVLLIATGILLGAAALRACGPYFPQWLITDEARILSASATWFKDALESTFLVVRGSGDRLTVIPSERPRFKAIVDEQGPYRQTAELDLRGVETATSDRNLTARYAEVRDALLQYSEEAADWRQERAWSRQPPPPPEAPDLEVPPGLPGELADYLRSSLRRETTPGPCIRSSRVATGATPPMSPSGC